MKKQNYSDKIYCIHYKKWGEIFESRINISRNRIITWRYSKYKCAVYIKRIGCTWNRVFHQSTVGDNPQRLLECFDEALKRSDLVITTGGLGPTKDDLTKEMAAEYFGQEMVLHEESWEYIKERCMKFAPGKPIPENNKNRRCSQ